MQTITNVRPDPSTGEPVAGYIVCWQYEETITQAVESLNIRIHEIIPSIPFNHATVHTTITVYQKQAKSAFQVNEQTLQALASAVSQLDTQVLQEVQIEFQEWLFNAEASIAAGQANKPFWEVGEQLQALCKTDGLQLRMPWGAHMTIARFLADSDRVDNLKNLVAQTAALGICQPQVIVVGYFTCGPTHFHLYPYTRREV